MTWPAPRPFFRRQEEAAAKAKKKPLGSITEVVASEKTKHLVLKIVGGAFATIIAPILVTYLIEYLEKRITRRRIRLRQPHRQRRCRLWSWRPIQRHQPLRRSHRGQSPGTRRRSRLGRRRSSSACRATGRVAVSKKLMELNPGFDGTVTGYEAKGPPIIAGGEVREIGFITDNVRDISPVRALLKLNKLQCSGSKCKTGQIIGPFAARRDATDGA